MQSTSETTARQRLRGQPNLTPGSSALLPVRITTARRPDHMRLSALVRSRSTQFIVHASSQLGHGPRKRGHFSAILAGVSTMCHVHKICTTCSTNWHSRKGKDCMHMSILTCRDTSNLTFQNSEANLISVKLDFNLIPQQNMWVQDISTMDQRLIDTTMYSSCWHLHCLHFQLLMTFCQNSHPWGRIFFFWATEVVCHDWLAEWFDVNLNTKRMPLHSGEFWRILRPNTLKNRKSAMHSGKSRSNVQT